MKSISVLLVLYFIFFFSPKRIYVSPDGNDRASGNFFHPVRTISEAQKRVRSLIKKGARGKIEVIISEGIYYLDKPLVFTPEDSGNDNLTIIYRSRKGSHPVITGALVTSDIKQQGKEWIAELPEGTNPYDIYVNGIRATRCRMPNKGYFKIKHVEQTVIEGEQGKIPRLASQKIQIPDKYFDVLMKLPEDDLKRVRFIAFHKWDNTIRNISGLDTSTKSFITIGEGMKPWNPLRKGKRIILENLKQALDSASEWFNCCGKIHYIPRSTDSIEQAKFTIPVRKNLIIIRGDTSNKKYVQNLKFQGLTFSYTNSPLSEENFEPKQAAASIDAAVLLDMARNISFTDCQIIHTGNYAIWFRSGCTNCSVENCNLSDLGAGGVRIGTTELPSCKNPITEKIIVKNNIISHGGRDYPSAVGIWVGQSGSNTIIDNKIFDFYYTGISVGWTWGYGKSFATDNKIKHNLIYKIGQGVLSDLGGIYTLGVSPGTLIDSNIIHDIQSYSYGGWGIYLDEGSTGIVVKNNLVYNTKTGGFHQHYGKNNLIKNNIFAYSSNQQLQLTRLEKHLSFTFVHNIVIANRGYLFFGVWKKADIKTDSNCYWFENGKKFDFSGMNFTQWQQKTKHDLHSIIENPGTLDTTRNRFTYNDDVIRKIDFKKIFE